MKKRDPERYHEECEQVAAQARAAGLRVKGLIDPELGWRPGVLVAHPLSERVWDFAVAHGCVASPSGKRHTIIERARP
jgi:hypothetical protein